MTEAEELPVHQVDIDWIRVEGRHRKDLGDLAGLAESMAVLGLINPVTVTPDGRLLAGGRRVAAARLLGWTQIGVREVDTRDDAIRSLEIERDENTERLDMKVSEKVSLGKAIEAMRRPQQQERRRQAGRIAAAKRLGRSIDDVISGSDEQNFPESMRTRPEIASAVGMQETSYYKAKEIVNAAADQGRTPEQRALAAEALANIDAGAETIGGAYERVRANRPAPQPRQRPTIDKPAAQRRAISTAEVALSGIAHGLDQITDLHEEITSEEAARWADSLSDSRRAITSLIKRLKERSNGTA